MRRVPRLSRYILHFKILFFFFSFTLCSFAQNFERFSNSEGFNQNTINAIAQDKYGFLWFGTPNGLIKYDGYEFETFTTQSKTDGSVSSNYITSLYSDANGVLWIGTNVSLNAYIPWLEKFFKVPLPNKIEISHITSDSNKKIWFSGKSELHYCELKNIEDGSFSVSPNILNKHSEVSSIENFSFVNDRDIVLATNTGLKKLNIESSPSEENLKIRTVFAFENFENIKTTFVKSIKNIFWVGTINGLYKTTVEENRIHILEKIETIGSLKKNSSPLIINTIFEDEKGSVWIGTKSNGLLKYLEKEEKFINYRYNPKNPHGLSSNLINTIFQDSYGVLWIGTAQGGINKFDITQKQFINYSENPYEEFALSNNLITSILEDNRGKLWVGVYNKDLFRTTTSVNDSTVRALKFKNLKDKFPFSETDFTRCIYEDKKGFIWFGTDSEIVVYNPYKDCYKIVYLTKEGKRLPKQKYRSVIQLNDSKFLIGGDQLYEIENPWNKIQSQGYAEFEVKTNLDLKQEHIFTLLKDSNNRIWVGTSGGIVIADYKDENLNVIKKISDEKSGTLKLSYPSVFTLHEDHLGSIWAGTFGGGLNKISLDQSGDPIKIDYFRKNDILPDDAIYGILQENDNYLWISTDMGLVKLDIKNSQADVFDVRDGLAHNNFRHSAYTKGKSGYFYFGGLNGLTIFNPENIQLNTTPPKILITSLLVNNKEVKIGEKLDNKVILDKSISETESISINQNNQTIALNVVVEHTSTPEKNELAYKLEGFNDEWIESNTGKETITYTNLSAGDYVFKVKAANGDGAWSSQIKSLNLTILPPWYQTWWSYLLFILIFLLVGIGIVIYFVQHEKLKQRLKYEQLDKERLDTINQGKFRYFTNISHEFRTPLTLISGPLEHLINSNKDDSHTKYLAIIQKNTKRLLSLVDQLITFRQAEQGFVSLNLNKISLGDFIHPTTEAFENFANENNINFYFKVSSPNEEIVIDVEKLERILFNLLSNAFKNTPRHGNISIEAEIIHNTPDKIIKIDVIDTGRGIPEENLHNIFERFYQLGNKKENISGGGIGLAFCKSMVELFNGKITVKSEPNVETRFSITLPSNPVKENIDDINTTNKSYIKDWVPLPSEYKKDMLSTVDEQQQKRKFTILLVEDEEDVQIFLSSLLSKNYNVLVAQDGHEALEKVKLKEPDLIISDVMMPKMDGFAFCEKIKSNLDTCHIPVLLLTALGDDENLIKGLEFGADEYISKPFSIKHLILRAERLLQNNIKLKEHFSKNSSIPKDNIEISKKDRDFLNSITGAIEKNISDSTFGVEELSSEIGLSPSQFYRRIKQLTGQIPNVYLRNFRLQRAAELLQSNMGYNVTEVMYQIGIESNSYFSTSFKKLYGVSPSQYSKKNRSS